MVEVKKRDKETSESLFRRFSRQLQQSRVLLKARKNRFKIKEKNRRQLREGAIYRQKVKKEVDRLKKIGKFDEEKFKDLKRKIVG